MSFYTKIIMAMMLIVVFSTQIVAKENDRKKPRRPAFSSIDIDNNGEIDFDEFSQQRLLNNDKHQVIFKMMDINADELISKKEFYHHKPPHFQRNNAKEFNMISSINSGMSMPPPRPSSASEQSLSDDQLTLISDTLSELDADNLTEEDALSIIEAFSEAGIAPGKEMESAISELGFDAHMIGELGNGSEKGTPPPPPPSDVQSSTEISEMVSFIEELLEEKLAESNERELTDQDKEAIYAKVKDQFGIGEDESLINTTA